MIEFSLVYTLNRGRVPINGIQPLPLLVDLYSEPNALLHHFISVVNYSAAKGNMVFSVFNFIKKSETYVMLNRVGVEPTSPGLSPGVLASKLPVLTRNRNVLCSYKIFAESKIYCYSTN